jgi:hypothetical protein
MRLSSARRGLEADRGTTLPSSLSFICSCTIPVLGVFRSQLPARRHDGTVSWSGLVAVTEVEVVVVVGLLPEPYTTRMHTHTRHTHAGGNTAHLVRRNHITDMLSLHRSAFLAILKT